MGAVIRQSDPAPIRACTVSRDVQAFEFLIDDMEATLGEAWGDLSFEDILVFLDQPDANGLEFIVIAVSQEDSEDMLLIEDVIDAAKTRQLGVVLVASDLDAINLHRLMRAGAGEFLPYPVPEGGLNDAIARVTAPPVPVMAPQTQTAATLGAKGSSQSTVIAVHGLAGGVGATTFAVNLAWELANVKGSEARVALIDLDLQFGGAATYLDLPRRDAVYELLSDTASADADAFKQAMLVYGSELSVFTAPGDVLPLDLITQEDVERLIGFATEQFDFVVIDMPRTLVSWTETVLTLADVYYPVVQLDMRSAQNALRFLKTLKAEDLPVEKLNFVMNRSPRFTDLSGRTRMKRMAESLDITIGEMLPDGGIQLTEANEEGQPLSGAAPKNPVRKEIARIAKQMLELGMGELAKAKG
jgi:pilus assembly protein CpaE